MANEQFPVRGGPIDVHRRVVRRRQITAGLAVAVGLVAAAAGGLAVPMVTGSGPGPERTVPPAFSGSAEYVGSSWRLTSVAEETNTTAIPAAVGARMDLLPDGRILINNGANALSGRFTRSADGFEVREVGTTFVLYDGGDPHRVAAIAALNTLAYGNRDGLSPSRPARDTVVAVDESRLVIQSGALRLTFQRTGPATDTRPDLPTASGKPS